MPERDRFRETFEQELMNAVTSGTEKLAEELSQRLGRAIEEVTAEIQETGRTAYDTKTGAELGAFLEGLGSFDYRSAVIRRLSVTEERETNETPFDSEESIRGTETADGPTINEDYVKQVVSGIREQHGYVSGKLISISKPRAAGAILSRFSTELNLIKDEQNSSHSETRWIERPTVDLAYLKQRVPQLLAEHGYVNPELLPEGYKKSVALLLARYKDELGLGKDGTVPTRKGIVYIEAEKAAQQVVYKPNMKFDYVWSKVMAMAEGKEDGITPREVLRAIIEEEKSQGKVPDGVDIDGTMGKYTPTVRLVLGQFVSGGKGLLGENGVWRLKEYGDKLTKGDIKHIEDRTLEVSAERERTVGRWTAEDVWPEHPNKVEQLYELKLNGDTYREDAGIGMKYIAPPGGRPRAVYFWTGGKGDFSRVTLKAYRVIAGQIVRSPQEERDVRGTFRDQTGRS